MADQFTRFLQGVGQGISNPKGNLGDFRHAARLYVDNQFARAPRTKFLYYVQFNMNKPAVQSSVFYQTYGQAVNALVKQADLPKITLEHEVKNQYNKKKIIYKEIKYEPLNIVFHDDNQGIINALWAQYLSYYSNERYLNPSVWTQGRYGPYSKNSDTKEQSTVDLKTGKGGDVSIGDQYIKFGLDFDKGNPNGNTYHRPFFDSITIYTMSRKKFNAYTLINPHITTWNHGNVDQASSNGTVECTMNIAYESVLYGVGTVKRGALPLGFADLYYDAAPSPLTIGGGQLTGIFGPGGLINSGSDIVKDAVNIFGSNNVLGEIKGSTNIFEAAVKAANFYKSLASLRPENLVAEATGILFNAPIQQNSTSGLAGVSFGGSGVKLD